MLNLDTSYITSSDTAKVGGGAQGSVCRDMQAQGSGTMISLFFISGEDTQGLGHAFTPTLAPGPLLLVLVPAP